MSPRAFFLGILGFGIVCWIGPTGAQNEIAPEQLDRPPVAAPTTKIQTGAIPVVLSDSQEADYFVSGMIRGLLVGSGVKGIALVVVKDDSVTFQRNAGSVAPDTRFAAGALTDVFGAVAAMQQVERGRLALDADIAKPLGETGTRGMNLGQVLAFQSGDPALAIRAVEKTAGAAWPEYAMKNIAQPLGMNATMCGDGTLQTTLADMGHLTIALVNGGVFQNGRALMPASVELMESTHVTLHPALPGWAYGFAETPRNGWRVLQHDAVNGAFASRLVIVPEAKLGYFIVAEGPTNAQFWRALDDGLFDRLLPPHAASSAASASGPAPTQTDAERVAGRYEFVRTPASDAASLKQGPRLNVRAGPGAELNLTGAETGTLAPRPGGYWASADGNVNAVALNGDLVLSTGRYGPLAFYKRPELYSFLALLAALAAGGFVAYERRRTPQARFPSDPVLGLASASIVFLLVSAFVWLFASGA